MLQEVRVRFAGFRNVEDEWVNVKRGVRERSIPLEPSECQRVKVGDLVLCYRVCYFTFSFVSFTGSNSKGHSCQIINPVVNLCFSFRFHS